MTIGNRILGVDEDSYVGTEICVVGELTDREMLLAMSGTFASDEIRGTTVNRLQAVLAETILTLNIEEGSKLVLPLSALIYRNMKAKETTSESLPIEGTLVELSTKLMSASRPSDKMGIGLELGDKGLHFNAGYYTPGMRRNLSERSRSDYSRSMALMGYESSQSNASCIPSVTSRSILQVVPPLIDNFDKASTVLSALINKEDPEVRRLIGVAN
jgi:hypothetical protein